MTEKIYSRIIDILCNFFNSKNRKKEIFFGDGYFLSVKKRIKKGELFLEIHTSGYDGTLAFSEAIDWIKWTLIDYKSNNIIL